MTRLPYLLDRARTGYRLGNAPLVDAMYRDGFLDPICGLLMGETAEKLADLYKIPREEQDAYALESQRRAGAAAREDGSRRDRRRCRSPVERVRRRSWRRTSIRGRRPRSRRSESSRRSFAKGAPSTRATPPESRTAPSSLLLVAESTAKERGLEPQAWVGESAVVGVDPSIMGIGPVPATRELIAKHGAEAGRLTNWSN